MTNRNKKHDLPSIGNGSMAEGQTPVWGMEIIKSRQGRESERQINLIIDTSVEREERTKSGDRSVTSLKDSYDSRNTHLYAHITLTFQHNTLLLVIG